ncbi:uncharacterized protein A1O9_05086 [Exophiala aquamarina CBS 119918]|uniref:DNA-binding protein RAP1 n=1 Tax=Exophiala aquamarina CBS 119918 TaxID=1182545 RepID=A0A072PK42_9EURO|nr:uncharacterized protein A1O9_05086 [Exophiala aquamarina CBS 119918]KEF60236.1 hypothetical protein A1O9_05086 [Exophiala aquamarina CBS 119918]
MTSNIVYDGVQRAGHEQEVANTLFGGQKLWFAHTVPQRKWLIENAQNNGAVIVAMDKDADVRLVDHAKKNNAPGTHSYRYIENSIRMGARDNLADHAVGLATRVSRPVGSTTTAPKHGRTPFTNEDDQQLWDWVRPLEERGYQWKGNEIYKQLESVNPRHTFQSWRDRYIKITRFQKRTTNPVAAEETHPTPEPSTSQIGRCAQQRKRARQDLDDPEGGGDESLAHDTLDPTSIGDDRRVRRSHQSPSDPLHTVSSLSKEKDLKRKDRLERPASKIRREMPVEHPTPKETSRMKDMSDRTGIVTGWEIPPIIALGADQQSFTLDEAKQLYDLVPQLTNLSAENFDEAWDAVAASQDWAGHTPQEWRFYFENFVLPEYCRNNKLPITEAAPYLIRERQLSTSTPKPRAVKNPRTDADQVHGDMKECGFCHEVKSARWHLDHKGNRVCTKCAIFLRVAGVPRPSTSQVEVVDDLEDGDLSRSIRTPQTNTTMRPMTAPASDYVHRGTSPITSNQDLDVSEKGSPEFGKPKSPVFRPDSSSLARVPEPNEARKRSTGNGSQSQSTSQESTKSGAQGQGTKLHAQPELSEASTEPQVLPSKNRTRDKRRLPDEPGNLDIPIQSLTRSDQLPSQHPANTRMMGFIEKDEPAVPPLLEAAPQQDNQEILLSESLSKDDEVDGFVTHPARRGASQALSLTKDRHEAQTSPLSVHLMSDNSSRRASRGLSASPEPPARSTTAYSEDPQTSTRFDRFETAPETPDGFDSAVEEQQPGPSASLAKCKERRASTQALFNEIGDSLDEAYLDFELPEPEGGWREVLGYDPDQLDLHELHNQEPRHREISRNKVKGKTKSKEEPQHDSALADLRLPSSPIQRRPKPVPTSTQESGGPQTSRWFAEQEAIHTSIHRLTLKPILFKALEATSFDFDLASEVVGIVVNQIPPKYRRRDKFTLGLEVSIPPNLPGVWTNEDDNLLLSHDSEDLKTVWRKHGDGACDARFVFLDQWVES